MKTLEQELQDAEKAAQEKRNELTAKHRVLDALREVCGSYREPFVHYYKLYGSRGSIKFEPERYSSLQKKDEKQPDVNLFAALLKAFPPLPKVMYQDSSFTSFRLASGLTEKEQGEGKTVLDICPVTVRLELYTEQTAEFAWYAEVAGEVWELECRFPLYSTDLGTLRIETERDRYENIIRYTLCDFQPKHGGQRIRYAAGDRKYPNPFVIWWDVDTGKGLDFPAIAQRVKA